MKGKNDKEYFQSREDRAKLDGMYEPPSWRIPFSRLFFGNASLAVIYLAGKVFGKWCWGANLGQRSGQKIEEEPIKKLGPPMYEKDRGF